MSAHGGTKFIPLNIAVLTVSDTRTEENDTSGQALIERFLVENHNHRISPLWNHYFEINNGAYRRR